MKNILIMQETEFSGTISMYPSTMQPLCTHVDKVVTSNFQICFQLHILVYMLNYSHMPNAPQGRTSSGLPYMRPAKHQISLRIHEIWSEPLLVLIYWLNIIWSFKS